MDISSFKDPGHTSSPLPRLRSVELEIFELLKKRRMCRDFKSESVPEDVIKRLIYAAERAPLGGNVSTRRLIVVRDKSTIHAMKLVSPGFGNEPPLAIVICTDESLSQTGSIASFDAGAAAENVALAAISSGLGAGFVKSYPEAAMKRLLRLPDKVVTEIVVMLGYPAEQQQPPPKAPPTSVYWEWYGNLANSELRGTTAIKSDYMLELALFILTSARTVVDEPSRYGPKRLMDSLQRVLEIPRHVDGVKEDPFLSSILSELKNREDMQISSVVYTEKFRNFLDSLIEKFVQELERRKASD